LARDSIFFKAKLKTFLFIITILIAAEQINFLLLDLLLGYIKKKIKIDKLSQQFFEIFNLNSIRKLFLT